ncbi:hypothetical protein U1Q18_050382, partial [Sarracenia purpurea var. burkii]
RNTDKKNNKMDQLEHEEDYEYGGAAATAADGAATAADGGATAADGAATAIDGAATAADGGSTPGEGEGAGGEVTEEPREENNNQ